MPGSDTHLAVICDVQTLWPHSTAGALRLGVNLMTGVVRGDHHERFVQVVGPQQLEELMLPWNWSPWGQETELRFHVAVRTPSETHLLGPVRPQPVPADHQTGQDSHVRRAVEAHLDVRTASWTDADRLAWSPDVAPSSQSGAEGFQLHGFLGMLGTWPAPLPQGPLRLSFVLDVPLQAAIGNVRWITASPEFSAAGIAARPDGDPVYGDRNGTWDYQVGWPGPDDGTVVAGYVSWSRVQAPPLPDALVEPSSFYVRKKRNLGEGKSELFGVEAEDLTDQLAPRAATVLDVPSRLLEGARQRLLGESDDHPMTRAERVAYRRDILGSVVAGLRDASGCGLKALPGEGDPESAMVLGPDGTCLALEVLGRARAAGEPIRSPDEVFVRLGFVVAALRAYDASRSFDGWLATLRRTVPRFSTLLDDLSGAASGARTATAEHLSDRQWITRVEDLVGAFQDDDILLVVLLDEWDQAFADAALGSELSDFLISYRQRIRDEILPTIRIRQRLAFDFVGIGFDRMVDLRSDQDGTADRAKLRAGLAGETRRLMRSRLGLTGGPHGYEALRPPFDWVGDGDESLRGELIEVASEHAQRFGARLLLPPDPPQASTSGGPVEEHLDELDEELDEGSPTKTAHPLVFQVERVARFDEPVSNTGEAEADHDVARMFPGYGVLLRWDEGEGGAKGLWRCLHAAHLEICEDKGPEQDPDCQFLTQLPTPQRIEAVSPSRLAFIDDVRRPMVLFDGNPPTALTPEQTGTKEALDERLSSSVEALLQTPMLRPHAPRRVPGSERTEWARLPPLAFGLWYEALPFALANSGALPADLARADHPAFLKSHDEFAVTSPEHIRRIRYLRRVGVGAVRVRPLAAADPTTDHGRDVHPIAAELDPPPPLHCIGPISPTGRRIYQAAAVTRVGGDGSVVGEDWKGTLDLSAGAFRIEVEGVEPGPDYNGPVRFQLGVVPDEEGGAPASAPIRLDVGFGNPGSMRLTVGDESWYWESPEPLGGSVDFAIEVSRIHHVPSEGDGTEDEWIGPWKIAALWRLPGGAWQQAIQAPPDGVFELPTPTPAYRVEVARKDDGSGWFLYRMPRARAAMPDRAHDDLPVPFGGIPVPGGPEAEAGIALLAPQDHTGHPSKFERQLARPALEPATYLRWIERDHHDALDEAARTEPMERWKAIFRADRGLRAARTQHPERETLFEEAVEDPAVSHFVAELVRIRGEGAASVEWEIIALPAPPAPSGGDLQRDFMRSHMGTIDVRIQSVSTRVGNSLVTNGGEIVVSLLPTEIAELRVYPAVDEGWFRSGISAAPGRRFHPNLARDLPRREFGGVAYVLFSPYQILAEAMSDQLPTASELWAQLVPSWNGHAIDLFWTRDRAPFRPRAFDPADNVGQVAHGHQGAIDTGRPVVRFPFGREPWDALPDDGDGPETNAMLWEAQVFGERDARSFQQARKRIAAKEPITLLHSVELEKDQRARHFRFMALVRHRYAPLLHDAGSLRSGASDRLARRADRGANDPPTLATDHWKRGFAPCRWKKRVPKPRVKLVSPLSRPAMDGDRSSLLIALDERWGETGGLAEWLDVMLETVTVPRRPGDDPPNPAQRPQYGPDPSVRGAGADTSTLPIELIGPIGHSFDTDTRSPLLVNSSFVLELGEVGEDRAFDMAKLRFRRILLPEGTADPATIDASPDAPVTRFSLEQDEALTFEGVSGEIRLALRHDDVDLLSISGAPSPTGWALGFQGGPPRSLDAGRAEQIDLRLLASRNLEEDLSTPRQEGNDEEEDEIEGVRPRWNLAGYARAGDSNWITLGSVEWEQPHGEHALDATLELEEDAPPPHRVERRLARVSPFTRGHWAQLWPLGPLTVPASGPAYAALDWSSYRLREFGGLRIEPVGDAGKLALLNHADAAPPRADHQGLFHLVIVTRRIWDASGARESEAFVGLYEATPGGGDGSALPLEPIGVPHHDSVGSLRARVALVQLSPPPPGEGAENARPTLASPEVSSGAALAELLFGNETYSVEDPEGGQDVRLRILAVFDPIEGEA